jgi:hypothetical protein
MEQSSGHMQTDQLKAAVAKQFVPVLELLGQIQIQIQILRYWYWQEKAGIE